MSNFIIGLLGDKYDPDTLDKWAYLTAALSNLSIKHYFLDDFDSPEDINKASINVLFTINDQGLLKWKDLLQSTVPLFMWYFVSPLKNLQLLKQYSSRPNTFLLASQALHFNYIDAICKGLQICVLPEAFCFTHDTSQNPENDHEISFISNIIDVDAYESQLKNTLTEDVLKVVNAIVSYALRNPEASLQDIFGYYSILFGYDDTDIVLFNDIQNIVSIYITDLRKVELIKALKKFPVHIWGSSVWSKYAGENIKYMGECPASERKKIFSSSKIVLNVDNYESMMTLNPYCFDAITSGSLLLSNHNLLMQQYFPKGTYDIYYSLNNLSEIPQKIAYYLQEDDTRYMLVKKMQAEVKENHTWEARFRLFLSMFEGAS